MRKNIQEVARLIYDNADEHPIPFAHDAIAYEIIYLFSPSPFVNFEDFDGFLNKLQECVPHADSAIFETLSTIALMAEDIGRQLADTKSSFRSIVYHQIEIYERNYQKVLERHRLNVLKNNDLNAVLEKIPSGIENVTDAIGMWENVAEDIFHNAKYFIKKNSNDGTSNRNEALSLLSLSHNWRTLSEIFFGIKYKYFRCILDDGVFGVLPQDTSLDSFLEAGRARHLSDMNEYAMVYTDKEDNFHKLLEAALINVKVVGCRIDGLDHVRKSKLKPFLDLNLRKDALGAYAINSDYFGYFRDLKFTESDFSNYYLIGRIMDAAIKIISDREEYFGILEVNRNSLIDFLFKSSNLEKSKIEEILDLMTFRDSKEKWIEVWDRPLFEFDRIYSFSPKIASSRSYTRSFENRAMETKKAIFSDLGSYVEDKLYDSLNGKLTKVWKRKKLRLPSGKLECDLLAVHERTLFIFEAKFSKSVYSIFDIRALTDKMHKAEGQLNHRETEIGKYKNEAASLLGYEFDNIVKIIVVNNFSIAGYIPKFSDIIYTDIMTIDYFMKDGNFYKYASNDWGITIESSFKFRSDEIRSDEFIDFLKRPLNVLYFSNYTSMDRYYISQSGKKVVLMTMKYYYGNMDSRFKDLKIRYEITD